ncbi:MAG: hypothetical protein AAFS11_11090, partial [Planctomycetota bacterium]
MLRQRRHPPSALRILDLALTADDARCLGGVVAVVRGDVLATDVFFKANGGDQGSGLSTNTDLAHPHLQGSRPCRAHR